jgi:hypothetical protein
MSFSFSPHAELRTACCCFTTARILFLEGIGARMSAQRLFPLPAGEGEDGRASLSGEVSPTSAFSS